MHIINGQATSKGIADGKVHMLRAKYATPKMHIVSDVHGEWHRFEAAVKTAKMQLNGLYEKALASIGEDTASIFDIHLTMLDDVEYRDRIFSYIITDKMCSEYAVYAVCKHYVNTFSNMQDDYMRERSADIIDLSNRLMDILMNRMEDALLGVTDLVVIAADEIMPSQTVQLDKRKISAFITRKGAYNSHASILARSLGIPAVAGLGDGFDKLQNNEYVIVDAEKGVVVAEPDHETLHSFAHRVNQIYEENRRLMQLNKLPAVTRDGAAVKLCVNIGRPGEVQTALDNGAEGVGLFRSEFLYLESEDFPSENAQYIAYSEVLKNMLPRRVVIRTLDLGADKQAPYFKLQEEKNPALGLRAIRLQLRREDVFLDQLRALLRASVHGHLAVMFPMVCGPEDIEQIMAVVEKAKQQLRQRGEAFADNIEWGAMIETPAAVVTADRIAKLVDFFSIGTNDLTQYTLATDRSNHALCELYNPGHLAVLRMVRHVAEIAHMNNIHVAICGESACDINLLPHYIAMGIDGLSMVPSEIPKVKEAIRKLNKADCVAMSTEALG